MTDPFEFDETERRVLTVTLLVYLALVVADVASGVSVAGAVADLLLGILLAAGSVRLVLRSGGAGALDRLATAALAAFLVAGLGIGYDGLATLASLPRPPVVGAVGSFALLTGILIYFYRDR